MIDNNIGELLMTLEEYNKEIEDLNTKHREEVFVIKRKYALANNTVKIGDIVQDNIGKARVEKIIIENIFSGIPCCVYEGVEQLKNGGDKKNSPKRHVWQGNLK